MKKSRKIALIVIAAVAVPISVLYGSAYMTMKRMDNLDNNFIDGSAYGELRLSEKDKIADCKYLLETAKSVPTSDMQAELVGFTPGDKREIYLEEVKNTKDDFEFFCLMNGILNDFYSCHTAVQPQDYSQYSEATYCASYVLSEKDHAKKVNYWKNLCNEKMSLSEDMDFLYFKYTEGKYLKSLYYSGGEYSDVNELISVDGTAVDEYIKQAVSGEKIKYDFIDGKAYRSGIAFTSSPCGRQAAVEYKDKDGNLQTRSLYTGVEADIMFAYHLGYANTLDSVLNEEIYSYADENTGYINFADMYFPDELKENLERIEGCGSVIIDLRNNRGGYGYVTVVLLQSFFNIDTHYSHNYYIENTSRNKLIFKPLFGMITAPVYFEDFKALDHTPYFDMGKSKYTYVTDEFDINGSNPEKDIYLLISGESISAADLFAAVAKDNGLAAVIGENTGGEGLMGTYCYDKLPESGIVFSYMPSRAANADGSENGLYGTAPDIYSRLSADDYYIKEDMLCRGLDPYTYENRLEWDSTLNAALEMIGKGSE